MPVIRAFTDPSLDTRGWWSPLFGAAGLIIPLFVQTEKHVIQRCTPWNSIALQYFVRPGRWGHAYLPENFSVKWVEVCGPPSSEKRTGWFRKGLFTADRITLYGDGLHRAACEYAITELMHSLRKGFYPYSNVLSLFGTEKAESPEVFCKLCRGMRTIIAIYEAYSFRNEATILVPEEWHSIWTDESGNVRELSRPWRFSRDAMEEWAIAYVIACGGDVRRDPDRGIIFHWQHMEYYLNDAHWCFERLGYSPSTEWQYWGKILLVFCDSAKNGGMMSVSLSLLTDSGMTGALEAFAQELSSIVSSDEMLDIVSEIEPAGELIAGVVLTLVGKLIIGVFCAFATGGGPWVVTWLTTALSRWSGRDIGALRQARKCNGAGVHVHIGSECKIRLLNTTCLSSAGSEHSRVLGVIVVVCGWVLARILYIYCPEAQQLLAIRDWDSTTGFIVGVGVLLLVCAVGLVTMPYTFPKYPGQRYFIWRMMIEWVIAIAALASVLTPVVVFRDLSTRWMISTEIAAWTIDFVMTSLVIGTYPDSISSWHSVWVLVPALLSTIGGRFGCWQ